MYGRSPAEDDGVVRGSQPLDAKLLRWEQNSETLMDPEYCGNSCEDVDIESKVAVLSSLLAPLVICGSRRIAEDQETLLASQPP